MSEDRYEITVTTMGKGSAFITVKEPGIGTLAINRLKPISLDLRTRINAALLEKGVDPRRYGDQKQWQVLSPITPTNAKSTGVSGLLKLMLAYYDKGVGEPAYSAGDATLVLLKDKEVIPRYLSKPVLDANRELIEPQLREIVAKLH